MSSAWHAARQKAWAATRANCLSNTPGGGAHWFQIFRRKATLFHSELDGLNGIWKINR